MEAQELARKLTEIAKDSPAITITERTCWLNGLDCCPYGHPRGQFLLRPRNFCRPSNSGKKTGTGCWIVDEHLFEFDSLLRRVLGQELAEVLRKNMLKLSGEIEAAADAGEKLEELKKEVIKLAANLVREMEEAEKNSPVKSIERIAREDDLLEALKAELGIEIEI